MAEKIHPVDIIVGRNIRLVRSLRDVTQTELGERIGVTFQQVQKYEKGANRVSASKLFEIAQVLETDVKRFFIEGVPASDDIGFEVPIAETLATKLDLMIMQRLFLIKDHNFKRRLLGLIDSLIDIQEIPQPGPSNGQSGNNPKDHDVRSH